MRLHRWAGFRGWLALLTIFATLPSFAGSGRSTATVSTPSAPTNIVIGFVGGFVRADNLHHAPVQIAQHIRNSSPEGTYVHVFENRKRRQAYALVWRLLDADHDGVLSADEKARARIILFGHSWGASSAVMLARDLRAQGVRVLLTVQVDSVAKLWQNDSVIPDNVAEAVNFYQTAGIIHGRRVITAADPAKTQILGNYLVDYKKNPISCPESAWWDHVFTPGHMQSECDPRLWSQVENMVRQRIAPEAQSVADKAIEPVPQSR